MRLIDRDAELIHLARGRRVLHLGAVGYADLSAEERVTRAPNTLHWSLTNVGDVTGIDYSRDVVDAYRRDGIFSNVIYGNVENLSAVDRIGTFDLIIAADIIEHLSNPGLMLESVKRFCNNDSEMVITTPNAFGISNLMRYMVGTFHEGAEHVMTFNMYNLCQLMHRHGFSVVRTDTCYQHHAARKRFFKIKRAVLRKVPAFGGTLLIVARLRFAN
jgi:SAM-dependent methyltransferase